MAHHISAVLLRGPFDADLAKSFGLKAIRLEHDLTMFPLDARWVDHWSERFGVFGFVADQPLLNSNVIHHMIRSIAAEPVFALIETEYFGGEGTQTAAAYHGEKEVMSPQTAESDTINKALRLLGIVARSGLDEFDTVGLGGFRDFDELFASYKPRVQGQTERHGQ